MTILRGEARCCLHQDRRESLDEYIPGGEARATRLVEATLRPYRVPAGEFYVLGDNRADSCDSRYWGPIEGSTIIGKVVLTFWHDNHPDFHSF